MALSPAQAQRYARHLILAEIGSAGQERLFAASVELCGHDAVAAAALSYLVAAGVGEIRLASNGAAPRVLLPLPEIPTAWPAAAQALASRLNPEVVVVAGAERVSVRTELCVGQATIAAAATGAVAVVAAGVCRRCAGEAAGHPGPSRPAAALFAGAGAAAEAIKRLLGLAGLADEALVADLDHLRFDRAPLSGCDDCRRRA